MSKDYELQKVKIYVHEISKVDETVKLTIVGVYNDGVVKREEPIELGEGDTVEVSIIKAKSIESACYFKT